MTNVVYQQAFAGKQPSFTSSSKKNSLTDSPIISSPQWNGSHPGTVASARPFTHANIYLRYVDCISYRKPASFFETIRKYMTTENHQT